MNNAVRILGSAGVSLQKRQRAGCLPPRVDLCAWAAPRGHACARCAQVGRVRVIVGRAGEFVFPFLKELEIALCLNF